MYLLFHRSHSYTPLLLATVTVRQQAQKLRYLGFRKVDRLRLCLPIHPVYSDLFCE